MLSGNCAPTPAGVSVKPLRTLVDRFPAIMPIWFMQQPNQLLVSLRVQPGNEYLVPGKHSQDSHPWDGLAVFYQPVYTETFYWVMRQRIVMVGHP